GWQPFPARAPRGPGAAWPAGAWERLDGDLVCGPDLGGAAGQVGARDAARGTAAPAAPERAAAEGERRQEQAGVAARADGATSQKCGVRELPRDDGPARVCVGALQRDRQVARGR